MVNTKENALAHRMASSETFGIAGLWREWDEGEGGKSLSCAMLTVNSNEHALMRRFHKPGDEKRSVVVVRPSDYDGWLASRSMDEARSFLNLFPVDACRSLSRSHESGQGSSDYIRGRGCQMNRRWE
ncbi:SOS response-associated peptidase family protein [Paraburkholderia sp. EG286A]|uniref:SOS response-associated peptidase family protein n=1 Tax=Paraburkholderia sp. EG286A TaxID=3237014 RepID=UPI0034D34D18